MSEALYRQVLLDALADAITALEKNREAALADAARFYKQKIPSLADMREREANRFGCSAGYCRRIAERVSEGQWPEVREWNTSGS